jgi:hypothetical protein
VIIFYKYSKKTKSFKSESLPKFWIRHTTEYTYSTSDQSTAKIPGSVREYLKNHPSLGFVGKDKEQE